MKAKKKILCGLVICRRRHHRIKKNIFFTFSKYIYNKMYLCTLVLYEYVFKNKIQRTLSHPRSQGIHTAYVLLYILYHCW